MHGRSVAALTKQEAQGRINRGVEPDAIMMTMALQRSITPWQLRTRALELGARTRIMAVINITPDSFSDGGLFRSTEAAVARCLECLDEDADILDLGAESTRPGSHGGNDVPAVSADEEQARLLPVIEAVLKERPNTLLSADTYKAATARAALLAGVEIVNDVSGFTWNPEMPRVCSETRCGVVLMHTRGRPDEWRTQARLSENEVLPMVSEGLAESLAVATRAGIAAEAIVLDPGYGFGKRFGENYTLLARQQELLALGRPLLAGVSRKSFLGHTLAPLHGGASAPPGQRETATIAALVAAILHGASIIRVHSVRPAVEAALIADAVLAAG